MPKFFIDFMAYNQPFHLDTFSDIRGSIRPCSLVNLRRMIRFMLKNWPFHCVADILPFPFPHFSGTLLLLLSWSTKTTAPSALLHFPTLFTSTFYTLSLSTHPLSSSRLLLEKDAKTDELTRFFILLQLGHSYGSTPQTFSKSVYFCKAASNAKYKYIQYIVTHAKEEHLSKKEAWPRSIACEFRKSRASR